MSLEDDARVVADQNDADMNDDDDDSNSGSSDTDDDRQDVLQFKQQVSFSPSYDNYEKYIVALRSAMMVDELRQAREDMASRYPLDKSMWIQWIDDEISVGMKSDDIVKLFDRALNDFLSIDIWLRYVEYVTREIKDPDQVTSLFERAVNACGAHFTEGSALWKEYRKFENDPKRQKKLFIRQLGVPSLQMEDVMEEYNNWHQASFNNSAPEIPSFSKAHSIYNRLLPFEAKLLESDPSSVSSSWTSYINSELSENHVHVNRVTILFERAIAVLFNSEFLWQKYIRFLRMNHLRNDQKSIVLEACRRAVRNCPWAVGLWCEFIISASVDDSALESAKSVYEEAMNQSFPTSDDYIRVVMEMCYAQARLLNSQSDPEPIRILFRRAVEFDQYSQDTVSFTDTIFNLYRYWAHVELHLLNSVENARDCWNTILKKVGKQPHFWHQYFQFEEDIGEIEKCRSAFRRGVHMFQHDDSLEKISSAWVRFETEHGSLKSRDEASFKISLLLEKQYLKQQSEITDPAKTATKRKLESTSEDRHIPKKTKHATSSAGNFQTLDSSTTKPASIFTVFVLNVDHKVSEKELEQMFSPFGKVIQVRIPRDVRGWTRGFAYIDFAEVESVEGAIKTLNRSELHGRLITVEAFKEDATRRTPRKTARDSADTYQGSHPESNIVFLRGFDKECSQAQTEILLRERFAKFGDISSVRIPTAGRSGRLKGIAYVEFVSNREAVAALTEDGFDMNGSKVSVAISNPPGKQKKEKSLRSETSQLKESKPVLFHPRGFAAPQVPVDKRRKPVLNVAQAKRIQKMQDEPVGKSNSDFRNMFLKTS